MVRLTLTKHKYNKIKDKKYYIVGTVKTNPIESVGRQNRYP